MLLLFLIRPKTIEIFLVDHVSFIWQITRMGLSPVQVKRIVLMEKKKNCMECTAGKLDSGKEFPGKGMHGQY